MELTCTKCNKTFSLTRNAFLKRQYRGVDTSLCQWCSKAHTEFKDHIYVPKSENHICQKCGKSFTLTRSAFNKRKCKKQDTTLCNPCRTTQTTSDRHGYASPLANPNILQKTKDTMQEKYGTTYALQIKDVEGVGYQKAVTTFQANYHTNAANPLMHAETLEKIKATNVDRYGDANPLNNPEVRAKQQQTMIKLYGGKPQAESEECRKRALEVFRTRYGQNCYLQSAHFSEKMVLKFGTRYPQLTTHSSSKEERHVFSKIEELFYHGLLKNSKYTFIYNDREKYKNSALFTFSYGDTDHPWDGIVLNEDYSIALVIDYDGEYYHGDYPDYDGVHSSEERDSIRMKCVPKDAKILIIYKDTQDYIKDIVDILGMDYDEWLNKLYNYCCGIDFPFYHNYYYEKQLLHSWKALALFTPEKCDKKSWTKLTQGRSTLGGKLINYFHPSIYKCHTKGKISPYDAWYHTDENGNRDLLRKCIRNRSIYANSYKPYRILQGFNISDIARKITTFSASRAKMLLIKYAQEFDQIFDPFMGFSGRLLGTVALKKAYIGNDINKTIIQEAKNLIRWFERHNIENRVILTNNDIQSIPKEYSMHNDECLFTCPPYKDTEIWYDEVSKREIRSNMTAEQWVEFCLDTFNCKRYIFVVDSRCNKYNSNVQEIFVNRRSAKYHVNLHEKVLVFDK